MGIAMDSIGYVENEHTGFDADSYLGSLHCQSDRG
jgi:hypothetical protein